MLVLSGGNQIKKLDEESCLYNIDTNSKYGSIQGQPSSEETSSRGNSDVEEGGSGSSHSSIKKRKKRRMAQRQCCQPDTITRLSTIFNHKPLLEDSEEAMKTGDLVLPSLDPK
jgi:hypothetical protein